MDLQQPEPQEYVIPFEQLSPELRRIITPGGRKELLAFRKIQNMANFSVPTSITGLLISASDQRFLDQVGMKFVVLGTLTGLMGYAAVRGIRELYSRVENQIRQNNLLSSEYKQSHPWEFGNSMHIYRTHPAFYIDKNNNLVFVKDGDEEYFRHLYQKGALGKVGLTPWMWRGYLRPPKASPEGKIKAEHWATYLAKMAQEKLKNKKFNFLKESRKRIHDRFRRK